MMSRRARSLSALGRLQRGTTIVEFAMFAFIFFSIVLGTVELARALFLWNTMVEATHRAARGAAHAGFAPNTLTQVRKSAMFADTPGIIMLGDLTPANLRIDFLNGNLAKVQSASMPACPEKNILNCNTDINGSNCIRFVRVRLCVNDGLDACKPVPYVPLVGAGFFPANAINIPTFSTIRPVGLLGHQPGTSSCP